MGGRKAISLGDVLHKTSELGLGSGFEFKRSTHFAACVNLWVLGQVCIFEGKTSICSEQTLQQDPSRRILKKELSSWAFSSRGSFSSPFLCNGHHLGWKRTVFTCCRGNKNIHCQQLYQGRAQSHPFCLWCTIN